MAKPPLPDPSTALGTGFTPVPRRYRHDGWTPARQKAFIEALADCGCVTRAAAQVNMAQANCYALRRAKGAEEFRAAWEAALDFGLGRLKDIAFERAIEGQLYPRFVGGRLMGFERRKNDALLMFCLRHYGKDANGKRTTINYFSTRASAGASTGSARAGPDGAPPSAHPELVEGSAADAATGEEGADWAEADPAEPYVALPHNGTEYRGALEPPAALEDWVPFTEGEAPWRLAGAEVPEWPADGEPEEGEEEG